MELVILYRRGQVDAFDQLVERHRKNLFGFILSMMGTQADADEVFQEVWLRVIKKIGMYREKNFGGWLIRIARNIMIDMARRRKADISLDEERLNGKSLLELIPGKDAEPAERLKSSELGGKISEALAVLPQEQREVFIMRAQANLRFKEIAGIQGVSINTVLARMQYALARLRTLLSEEYEGLK